MADAPKRKSFFQKRTDSFRYSWRGIRYFLSHEFNAKVHFVAACLALFLAGYFEVTRWEWVAIIACITMVISAEMLNTAIERIVDILFPNEHPNAAVIKDIAAGAVLVIAVGALLIAYVIFLPYLTQCKV